LSIAIDEVDVDVDIDVDSEQTHGQVDRKDSNRLSDTGISDIPVDQFESFSTIDGNAANKGCNRPILQLQRLYNSISISALTAPSLNPVPAVPIAVAVENSTREIWT
jgi:hypothetical protein